MAVLGNKIALQFRRRQRAALQQRVAQLVVAVSVGDENGSHLAAASDLLDGVEVLRHEHQLQHVLGVHPVDRVCEVPN